MLVIKSYRLINVLQGIGFVRYLNSAISIDVYRFRLWTVRRPMFIMWTVRRPLFNRLDSSSSDSCCNYWTVRRPMFTVLVSGTVRRPSYVESALIVASSSAVDFRNRFLSTGLQVRL